MSFVHEQVVVFRIGSESYAVSIRYVSEVILWQRPTPLPGSPPAVRGVIDLRGRVVPVLDLADRFGLTREPSEARNRIVVLEPWQAEPEVGESLAASGGAAGDAGWRRAGLEVDEVTEVRRVDPGQMEDPGPVGPGRERLVLGVIRLPDRLLMLLDPVQVVAGLVGAGTAAG